MKPGKSTLIFNNPLYCFFMVGVLLLPGFALAEEMVVYDVSFPNAVHHEAQISVAYTDLPDGVVEFRMSRSSPGRYALHEFAKNVYAVSAVDGEGHPLEITRPDPYQWNVSGHDGTVTITYTLYADRAGGTYSGIDLTHAHLNIPATFMWARGYDERPIEISFQPLESWKIATQLEPTDDPNTYRASNLQYFMDSPTELSDFTERRWQIEHDGKAQTIRLAVHHDGTEEDVDKYAEKAKKVVAELIAVFGEPPDFDFGTYTFIADYLPHVSGDGMEHRNSTVIARSTALWADEYSQISTLSHEFFHGWNVERIRPADLEPFNYEKANMSSNLWFAEGFTRYYGLLALRRAGERDDGEFIGGLGNTVDRIIRSPARAFASPIGMSRQAPFVDASRSIDPTNFENTFISYYSYGEAIAAALDLTLRSRFEGLTLDDYMRLVWQRFGKTEQPYTGADLEKALADLTGDAAFSADFFGRFIRDSEVPDYKSLLENAGFLLRKKNEGKASAGHVRFEVEGEVVKIANNTVIGSPLYEAGLDGGDHILMIDDRPIRSEDNWDTALKAYQPGDRAVIAFIQRGVERSAEIVFEEDQTLEIVTFEAAGMVPTEDQLAFRKAWLGSKR